MTAADPATSASLVLLGLELEGKRFRHHSQNDIQLGDVHIGFEFKTDKSGQARGPQYNCKSKTKTNKKTVRTKTMTPLWTQLQAAAGRATGQANGPLPGAQ